MRKDPRAIVHDRFKKFVHITASVFGEKPMLKLLFATTI